MPTSGVYLVSASFQAKDGSPYSNMSKEDEASSYDSSPVRSSDEINLKIQEAEYTGSPFRGMGKEELLKHSSKPFWVRLRMLCISIILLGWLALIITVVALVFIYPRCRAAEPRVWWQKEVIYRIYVPSFKDSDGDGIGDLKGVESKLDYIKDLGFDTISLSPIYHKDNFDSDFNLLDHKVVGTDYGNMNQFRTLINAIHDKGMHLILDFIPNHTSDKHVWFDKSASSADRSNNFRNYYVWTTNPVSNWRTVYDNSSWTQYTSGRNQYYLHQFLSNQPDLNLRSSQVQDQLEDILRFWLDLGVDGFNVRHSAYLFEDYDMRDEIKSSTSQSNNQNEYSYYDHKYTFGLPEVHDMLSRWRTVLNEFGKMNNTNKFIMADITTSDINITMSYYGLFDRDGVHVTANLDFMNHKSSCDGACINTYVSAWMDNLPNGRWASWMAGNEDSMRFGSRFNQTFMKAFNMLAMLLPGTPVVYYGDEIKMEDLSTVGTTESWSQKQVMRGLMLWNNDTDGGFQSDVTCPIAGCRAPWTDAHDSRESSNMEIQNVVAGSMLNFMKNVTALRKHNTFIFGDYARALHNKNVFSFVRELDGENGYLVAINFGETAVTNDYTGSHGSIQNPATVDLTTGSDVGYAVGDEIATDSISLKPHQGIVLSWAFKAKEI